MIEPGSIVLVHLSNPAEQFWGILEDLSPAGVTFRGLNDPLYDLSPDRFDKLRDSSGNIICWLGSGSYPSGWWVPPGFNSIRP